MSPTVTRNHKGRGITDQVDSMTAVHGSRLPDGRNFLAHACQPKAHRCQSTAPGGPMPPETLLAFITYAFVTSITPGPNNTMLLASGVNYGFVRSLPHVLGISIGFGVMVVGVGAGLGRLFEDYPRCTPRCASWAALTCCTWPGRSRRPRRCRTPHPMAGRSGSGKQQAFNGSIPRHGSWRSGPSRRICPPGRHAGGRVARPAVRAGERP